MILDIILYGNYYHIMKNAPASSQAGRDTVTPGNYLLGGTCASPAGITAGT